MAVVQYWRERLVARHPLYLADHPADHVRGGPEGIWPRAVARQALIADYRAWFDRVYLTDYRDTPYFQDFPERLPKVAKEFEFWTTLSPFVYLVGRSQQSRSYVVMKWSMYEGRQVRTRAKANFIRLLGWDEHVAAFENLTGMPLHAPKVGKSVRMHNIKTVTRGVDVTIRRISERKSKLPEVMR